MCNSAKASCFVDKLNAHYPGIQLHYPTRNVRNAAKFLHTSALQNMSTHMQKHRIVNDNAKLTSKITLVYYQVSKLGYPVNCRLNEYNQEIQQ